MKQFLIEVLSCLSRLLNVCLGGTSDLPLSARSHIELPALASVIDWLFLALFGVEDHCRASWLKEVENSTRTIHMDLVHGGSAAEVED